MNKEVIQDCVRTILIDGLGLDIENNKDLKDTPARVARMYGELYLRYDNNDLDKYLKFFDAPGDETKDLVLVGPIKTYSNCSHHMVPFYGDVYIAYLPKDKILGLSKFPRIVQDMARQLTLQENLTHEIADYFKEKLDCDSIYVAFVNGHHMCVSSRGAKADMATTTMTQRGNINDSQKREFLAFINR